MRITAFILLVACLQVSASGHAQITLSERSAPLEKVLQEIREQSGYDLVYELTVLRTKGQPVSIDVRNVSLSHALDEVFRSQPLTFEIVGKIISVKEKETIAFLMPITVPPPPIDVHGRITDSLGNPLAGASVFVKKSSKGTVTDPNGFFELKGIEDNATLIISFTGFGTREYKVHGQPSFTLALSRVPSPLDQVQVIAYGQTTQRFNVGNVQTVSSEDIEKHPVTNVLMALEGQVPGLFITQSSGNPGTGIKVQIQGQNSISNGNDPFYVIDGVPYTSQLLPNLGWAILGNSGGAYSGSPLSYINPSDIESISVLKDADATAIYGSRAANGAILITTKKGKAGDTKFEANVQNGYSHITRTIPFLHTKQYLQMRHEALANEGISQPGPGDYDINGTWDTTRYTDWQKVLINGAAQYTDGNTSFSGGSANTQYQVSGDYNRQTTVFPGKFSDQKASLHASLSNSSVNQRFKLQLTLNYSFDDNHLPFGDPTPNSMYLAPDAPALYNADGSLNWALSSTGSSTWSNPIAGNQALYISKTRNLVSNAILSYEILHGLEIRTSLGYTDMVTNELSTYPLSGVSPNYIRYNQRSANYAWNDINSWIIEPQLNYKKKWGRSRVDILLGSTIHANNSNGQQVTGTGYNSDLVLADIQNAASVTKGPAIVSTYRYNAAFGRINYNFDEKYVLDLTTRRDGSSRFGSANEFHNFASVGAGWIFTQEKFIRDNLEFLSFGKLKASYGSTGNDQIGDYQFLNLYFPVYASNAYQGLSALQPINLPNPYLEWELTKKLNVGFDLGFVKDRFFLSVDYFRNRSSNQLLSYNLPDITGFTSIAKNFPATVQNSGLEFSLRTTNIKSGKFSWTSRFNLSIHRNKLLSFPNLATSSYASQLIVGKSINIFRTYHYLGVNPTTGLYQFSDAHGNPTSTPTYLSDANVVIDPTPPYFGGLENTFTYKGLQLDFLLQFIKQRAYTFMYGYFEPGSVNTNEPVYILDRWQKPGDVKPIERFNANYNTLTPFFDASGSDMGYADASFIRLKNLSLSWQLPDPWIKKAGFQQVRFFVQGENLLLLTHYKGPDPEIGNEVALPPLRTLTMGLRVGL